MLKPILGSQLNQGHPPAKGLVGDWLFNEGGGDKVFDLSGSGNTGTLNGDLSWIPGKFGPALDFPGADDYINCGNIGNYVTSEVTVRARVRFDNLTSTQLIVCKAGANTQWEFALEFGRTDKRVTIVWGNNIILVSDTDLNTGVWYDIVIVRSGVTGAWGADIYVDGKNDGSTTTAINPLGGTGEVLFGAFRVASLGSDFNGQVDNIQIWNRALSASESARLCQEPFARFAPQPIDLWTGAASVTVPTPTTIPVFMHHYMHQ